MKITNYFISFLIILILSLFALSKCDNKPSRKLKKVVRTIRNISIPRSESKKQEWIFNQHKNCVFGVDFSHHQGLVDWDKIRYFNNKKEISFVVLRATMGTKRKDNYFTHNWKAALKQGIIRGAYHYYRPNENSTKQANNYIKRVKLRKGDLPPILDIESLSRKQSVRSLQIGLKNWLNIIEKHYGVKPIIYSGDKFNRTYLQGNEFKSYLLWIANYNRVEEPKTKDWSFWQFSEKGKINGVNEFVDFNVFKGSAQDLEDILIK